MVCLMMSMFWRCMQRNERENNAKNSGMRMCKHCKKSLSQAGREVNFATHNVRTSSTSINQEGKRKRILTKKTVRTTIPTIPYYKASRGILTLAGFGIVLITHLFHFCKIKTS